MEKLHVNQIMGNLSKSDWELIFTVNAIASSFSLLGSLFIISVYLNFKELRVFAFKLVAILSCLDAIHSIAFLIPTYDYDRVSTACQIQSVALTFCTLASVLWTAMIALALYLAVIKERKLTDRYRIYAFAFAVILPFIVS